MLRRLGGLKVIAVSSVFFAAMSLGTRSLSHEIPAAQIATIRHLVGLCAVAGLFALRAQWPKTNRPLMLLLRGVLGGISVLGYFYAIEKIGAAPATVLNYCAPMYAACFAVIFLKERPPRLLMVGLVLSTAGAILVTLSTSSGPSFNFEVGTLVGLLAGITGGAAMTVVKAVRDDSDPGSVFLSFSAVGLAFSSPLSATQWHSMTMSTLALGIAIGALACIGQLLFTWGMGHTSATAGSAMTQLVPALVWIFSVAFMHQPVSPTALCGAALCTVGVLCLKRG